MSGASGEYEEVSRVLDAASRGDRRAACELTPLVYSELKRLAASRLAHDSDLSLQATGLVHEAYLQLVAKNRDRSFNDQAHFFAAAAEAMRLIMIDRARDRKRKKRGGGARRLALSLDLLQSDDASPEAVLAFDDVQSRN